MKYYPDSDSFVAVLCNDDDTQKLFPVFRFCDQAVKGTLLTPINAETLGKIAGEYQGGGRTYKIPATGDNPVAEFGVGWPNNVWANW